jgi:hypothetical protein
MSQNGSKHCPRRAPPKSRGRHAARAPMQTAIGTPIRAGDARAPMQTIRAGDAATAEPPRRARTVERRPQLQQVSADMSWPQKRSATAEELRAWPRRATVMQNRPRITRVHGPRQLKEHRWQSRKRQGGGLHTPGCRPSSAPPWRRRSRRRCRRARTCREARARVTLGDGDTASEKYGPI